MRVVSGNCALSVAFAVHPVSTLRTGLGTTELPLAMLEQTRVRAVSMGIAEQEFTHTLDTQGTVTFRVRVNEQTKLSEAYVAHYATAEQTASNRDGLLTARLPRFGLLRDHSTISFTVQVKAAVGLMAADAGGTSDPYVVFTPGGGSVHKTHTVSKTVEPVWNEELSVSERLGKLLRAPACFEVYDEDQFSKDDLLGRCELDLEAVLDVAVARAATAALPAATGATSSAAVALGGSAIASEGMGGDRGSVGANEVWIRLPLETATGARAQGQLLIKLSVDELEVPSWTQLAKALLHPPAWLVKMVQDAPKGARRLWQEYVMPMSRVTEWPDRYHQVLARFRQESLETKPRRWRGDGRSVQGAGTPARVGASARVAALLFPARHALCHAESPSSPPPEESNRSADCGGWGGGPAACAHEARDRLVRAAWPRAAPPHGRINSCRFGMPRCRPAPRLLLCRFARTTRRWSCRYWSRARRTSRRPTSLWAGAARQIHTCASRLAATRTRRP